MKRLLRAGLLPVLLIAGCDDGEGSSAPGPDAGPAATSVCDPVVQICPSAADKCTLIDPSGSHNERACVPRTGNVGEGQPCQRVAEDNTGFGRDNCAAGLSCTYIGVLPPRAGGTRLCRRFCHGDGDCAGGQRCAKVSDATPADGFCGPPCTPLGSDCPDGMSCADVWPSASDPTKYFAVCRVAGTVADGAACTRHEDCAANRACVPAANSTTSTCRPICDSNHPCASGACQVVDAMGGIGYCG